MNLESTTLHLFFALLVFCLTQGQGQAQGTPRSFLLRTHQPLYQNPFDLASGGSSITRATQEGSFFVNPSLPAFGLGLHRWTFARTQVHVGDALARTAYEAYSDQGSDNPVPAQLLQKAITSPVHVGHDTAAGYINRFASIVGFSNVRADLNIRRFGDAGAPHVRVRAYGVGGGGLGLSYAFGQFLAVGISTKYIEIANVTENVSLTAIQNPESLPQTAANLLKRGQGLSHDAGLTLQLRSKVVDLRLASTVHDLGGTLLGPDIDAYPQTIGAGIGLTLHSRKHALHCSGDLRDVLAAYGEHWTYRSYAGCKILIYEWVGLGAGLSQGYPTAGAIIDLPFSRFELGTYTREVGQEAGVEGRSVVFFAMGFEL